jgi:hypothetical protein
MKASPFQALEQVLYFPSQAIDFQRLLETLVSSQNQQFATVQLQATEPDLLLTDSTPFSKCATLAHFQVNKQ